MTSTLNVVGWVQGGLSRLADSKMRESAPSGVPSGPEPAALVAIKFTWLGVWAHASLSWANALETGNSYLIQHIELRGAHGKSNVRWDATRVDDVSSIWDATADWLLKSGRVGDRLFAWEVPTSITEAIEASADEIAAEDIVFMRDDYCASFVARILADAGATKHVPLIAFPISAAVRPTYKRMLHIHAPGMVSWREPTSKDVHAPRTLQRKKPPVWRRRRPG